MGHSSGRIAKKVILAAGGSGTRMGADIPKQFMLLKGRPLIVHTIESFLKYDSSLEFIVALPPDYVSYWNSHVLPFVKDVHITICEGGRERFHSVKNALQLVEDSTWVTVQDAVRPFASVQLIERCFDALAQHDCVIPATAVHDSIRQIREGGSVMLDRKELRAVQTPQCFKAVILKRAYRQDFNPSFTDDASVVEAMGIPVHIVQGERTNIKITTVEDVKYAEWRLSESGFSGL